MENFSPFFFRGGWFSLALPHGFRWVSHCKNPWKEWLSDAKPVSIAEAALGMGIRLVMGKRECISAAQVPPLLTQRGSVSSGLWGKIFFLAFSFWVGASHHADAFPRQFGVCRPSSALLELLLALEKPLLSANVYHREEVSTNGDTEQKEAGCPGTPCLPLSLILGLEPLGCLILGRCKEEQDPIGQVQ